MSFPVCVLAFTSLSSLEARSGCLLPWQRAPWGLGVSLPGNGLRRAGRPVAPAAEIQTARASCTSTPTPGSSFVSQVRRSTRDSSNHHRSFAGRPQGAPQKLIEVTFTKTVGMG